MVLFGAPKQVDESVQAWSALRTAFGMQERMEELSTAMRARGIPADLTVRVGVNTGHCTVGVLGSDIMRAYKAVGFAVNVAARLQSEAEPGTVLVGFRTYALVKDRVVAEQRAPLMLKGAARPVEAWEIRRLVETGDEDRAPLA
jgi:class 3 adenylate cyclase